MEPHAGSGMLLSAGSVPAVQRSKEKRWIGADGRRATRDAAEYSLLQLLQLMEQADGVKCMGNFDEFLLLLGRQNSWQEQTLE
jgi:hypothetical protein